jgi:uncharacterized protein YndB with AHSA1/START domain
MTTEPTPSPNAARLERTYDAPAELIWEPCTTAAGLEEPRGGRRRPRFPHGRRKLVVQ